MIMGTVGYMSPNKRKRNLWTSAPTSSLSLPPYEAATGPSRSPASPSLIRCTRSFTSRRPPSLTLILQLHRDCSASSANVWRKSRRSAIRQSAHSQRSGRAARRDDGRERHRALGGAFHEHDHKQHRSTGDDVRPESTASVTYPSASSANT